MGIMTKEAVLDLIDRMRTSDPKANGFYEGTAQWAAWQEARNLTDMSLLQVLEDIICEHPGAEGTDVRIINSLCIGLTRQDSISCLGSSTRKSQKAMQYGGLTISKI